MSLPAYKVLGAVTFVSLTTRNLKDVFSSQLDSSKWSTLVNKIIFKADPANGAVVDIQDLDGNISVTLAAGQRMEYQAGAQSNCLDPRDFALHRASTDADDAVYVSILKV